MKSRSGRLLIYCCLALVMQGSSVTKAIYEDPLRIRRFASQGRKEKRRRHSKRR